MNPYVINPTVMNPTTFPHTNPSAKKPSEIDPITGSLTMKCAKVKPYINQNY